VVSSNTERPPEAIPGAVLVGATDVTIETCGDCYMVVCVEHKRIAEQCGCTSARKRRIDVPCPSPPNCWVR
jgi:translation initiation factor 2 gamma subunit (eIF-2gamma)